MVKRKAKKVKCTLPKRVLVLEAMQRGIPVRKRSKKTGKLIAKTKADLCRALGARVVEMMMFHR